MTPDEPATPEPEKTPRPPQPEKAPVPPRPSPAPANPDLPNIVPVPPRPEKAPDPEGDPAPIDDPIPEPDGDPSRPDPGVIHASAGVSAASAEDGLSEDAAEDGPLRRCALSRIELPIADMIRFVAAPDGTLVPDLAHKLPGRGVWVDARREAIEEAMRRGAFAKSLKRKVIVPHDLGPRLSGQLVRRLIDSLALANKAGLVVTGATKISAALDGSGIVVLVHGSDAARDGVEKLDRKFKNALDCGGSKADLTDVIIQELAIDEISLAIGRPNVVHAALRSGGATVRLLENARRLKRFRGSRVQSF